MELVAKNVRKRPARVRTRLAVSLACASMPVAVLLAAPAAAQSPDVSGEPYGRAVAILGSYGYRGTFGGSVGSDVGQAQCVVVGQKDVSRVRVALNLDCTRATVDEFAQDFGGPTVGSNNVTTHRLTPVPAG